jgi:predicted MPP superfamily phosphohydrolase
MNSHLLSRTEEERAAVKKKKKNPFLLRVCAVLSSLAAVLVLLNWGTKTRFVSRYYEIADARIRDDVRIAVISDLHGALYGAQQSDLLAALEQQAPHVVLLLGDIFDQRGVDTNAKALLSQLAGRFLCYFIPGNHEYRSGEMLPIREVLRQANVPLLTGESAMIVVNQTQVQIFGVDDGQGGKTKQLRQIEAAGEQRSDEIYSILAIHVPNDVESYLHYGFDLMLSGHTHGGQIIIPGLLNGLYAPGQGLFPKYGGGCYDFGKQALIISRGLTKRPYWLPRLGNPPELCFVTLTSSTEP